MSEDQPASARAESPDQIERMGYELAMSLMPRIREWQARTGDGPKHVRVNPRSPLAVLDEMTSPFQTSHIALMYLGAAADHLNTLRLILVETNTLPLWGVYPILRAALECHASAVYVLGPRSRQQQVRHRLKVAAANHQHEAQAEALSTAIAGVGQSTARVYERLVEVAAANGVRKDEIDGKPVSMLTIVRYAGEQANLDHIELYWRLLSGLAHGQQWSGSAVHERREITDEARKAKKLTADPDVAHVHTTNRWSYVGTLLAEGMEVGEAAWERWRVLSRR